MRVKKGQYEILPDGSLVIGDHSISSMNYTIDYLPSIENEDIWSDRELIVSLNLNITEDLKIEGTAINLNRHIQDLRKKLDLPYDARIILSIEATGVYGKSILIHKNWLMEQSLAVDLKNTVNSAMFEKDDNNGQLKIHLQKAL